MNWVNRIRLIYRSCTQRLFVSLLLIAMCIVSFYMIYLVISGYTYELYAYNAMHNMFGGKTEEISYIKCLNYDATREDVDLLKKHLASSDDVIATGYFSTINTFDLIEEQSIDICVSDIDLIGIGNLKLSDELNQTVANKKEGCYQVVMGCNYKGKLQVGDKFTLWEQPCVVAGFLQKGASWPRRGGISISTYNKEKDVLDNQGILLVDDYKVFDNFGGKASELYFVTEDGTNASITEAVKEYALDNKIAINVVNVEAMIQEEVEASGYTGEGTFGAAVLLTILAVVSISAATLIMCIINKKHYGVMMICGVRRADVKWLIVVQNFIYYLLGAIVAWIVRFKGQEAKLIISGTEYIVFITVTLIFVMVAISSALPLAYFRKMSLVEMVHKE